MSTVPVKRGKGTGKTPVMAASASPKAPPPLPREDSTEPTSEGDPGSPGPSADMLSKKEAAQRYRKILEDAAAQIGRHVTLREVEILRDAFTKTVRRTPPGQLTDMQTQCDNVLWSLENQTKQNPEARTGDLDRCETDEKKMKLADRFQILNIPRQRRTQTFVVTCLTFFSGMPFCIFFSIFLLYYCWETRIFMFIYMLWMNWSHPGPWGLSNIFDRWITKKQRPAKGSTAPPPPRRTGFLRPWKHPLPITLFISRLSVFKHFRDYFPIRLVVPRTVRKAVCGGSGNLIDTPASGTRDGSRVPSTKAASPTTSAPPPKSFKDKAASMSSSIQSALAYSTTPTVAPTVPLTLRNYIFCYHPHGVHSFGAMASFATDSNDISRVFPGISIHVQTLGINFLVPFWRELGLWCGMGDASAYCIRQTLKSGPGQSVLIVVGGAEESLMASPKTNDLLLSKRKGFVKIALETGSPLVPVFGFGENNVYGNWAEGRPWLQRLLKQAQKKIGFALPLIKGRTWFTYSGGVLPHRRPIVTVVGMPLEVPTIPRPTPEQIDLWHRKYCEALMELYRENKDIYDLSSFKSATIVS